MVTSSGYLDNWKFFVRNNKCIKASNLSLFNEFDKLVLITFKNENKCS